MEHPIVTHLLNRHHALLRHRCESLTGGFDRYFDRILIRLIVGQKPLLPLHLGMGMLASGDIIYVYLLSIMVLMRGHDIKVHFISRKARIQRMNVDCLNYRLATLHLNYSLTNRIFPCTYILDTSQGGTTCNVKCDLIGIPAAVRLHKFLLMLAL